MYDDECEYIPGWQIATEPPNPIEPIEVKLGELPWKEDRYNLMLQDAEFLYNASGPGDIDDIWPRTNTGGESSRIKKKPLEDEEHQETDIVKA